MSQSTVNTQKMKAVASELDKNYATFNQQLKKLDESMGTMNQLWKGEGAQAFQAAYLQNTQNFLALAEAILSCSTSLTQIASDYNKADAAAAEAIKSKMGGKR